ncbi:MAG: response regulator, partial [Rhodoferax sp.]
VPADIVAGSQSGAAACEAQPPKTDGTQPEGPLHGHILVAEDNPINAMVMQSFAARLGLTMTLVGDGQKALNAIAHSSDGVAVDLVLMDVHMPVMDGYTATERIRQWETAQKRPRIPIIALTADAFEEDRQRCFAAGMDDFLSKPVALGVLRSMLAKWLITTDQRP